MSDMSNTTRAGKHHLRVIILLVLLCVFGSLMMFWITAIGPGASPDSVMYIGTARSLLEGDGFSYQGKTIIRFPPVYPYLLALVGFLSNGDVLFAARLITSFLVGLNAAILGYLSYLSTERSIMAALTISSAFLISTPIMKINVMAWSEIPFITFVLLGFVFLSFHIVRPNKSKLLAASLSFGLAMTIRYVGITLIPPVVFSLIYFNYHSFKKKIQDSIIFVIVSMVPLISWMIRNAIKAETPNIRTFTVHLIELQKVNQMVSALSSFLLPGASSDRVKEIYLGLVLVFFIIIIVFLYRKNLFRRDNINFRTVLPVICLTFALTNITFTVFTISFFDALTTLSPRMVLPAFLAVSVTGFSLVWSLSERLNIRLVWVIFILSVLLSALASVDETIEKAEFYHNNGIRFTSRIWQNSETIAYVRSLPKEVRIYSTRPEIINLHTGRIANKIPDKINSHTHKPNPDFTEQVRIMCRELNNGDGILIILKYVEIPWYRASLEDLEEMCDLPDPEIVKGGTIYER